MKQKMIAANIGIDPSTVSRELAKTSLKEEKKPVSIIHPMHSVKRYPFK